MAVRPSRQSPLDVPRPWERVVQYALLAVVAFVILGPLFWLVTSAVKAPGDIFRFPPTWIPLEPRWSNFAEVWQDAPFARYFLNSMIVTVSGTVLEIANAVLCAYAFVFLRFPWKRVLFLVLLGAMMVPGHVVLLPNYVTISALGWANTYLGLIVPGLGSVFATFLLRQHMLTIPASIIDASKIDGARHLRILWSIVLPLSRPILITVTLVTLVTKWNDFVWPLIVTNSESMRTLPIALYFFKNDEGYTNWAVILAAAVMVMLPILIAFFVAQRQIIAGFTHGAVRG